MPGAAAELTPESTRLDTWLDVACLFRTRSEASKACKSGQVEVNGQDAKPHRLLRPGDEVRIARSGDRRQTVVVRGFAARHVPRAQARQLYEDLTPPPTPEQVEERRIQRLLRQAQPEPLAAPHRRDQRAVRQLRGKE